MDFPDNAIYFSLIYSAAPPVVLINIILNAKRSQILRNKMDIDSPETQMKRTSSSASQ